MANPEEVKRNYAMQDTEMTEFSHSIRSAFITYKTNFIGFDPDFSDPFDANWLLAIEDAEAQESDETVSDELIQLGNTVEEKMELCRHKFQSSKYFIEKAFPTNFAVRNEFGYDDYDEARDKQAKMIAFMFNFHRVAKKYKLKLITKNYTQAMIDEIGVLHAELHDANNAQEAFKTGRPVLTQARVIVLNTCWSITLNVCNAGKTIFYNDKAKHDLFLLPGSGGTTPLPQSISFIVLLTDADRTISFDYTGNIFATGDMLTQTWETGTFNTVVLSNGIHGVLQWTYSTSGEKKPILTGNTTTIGAMDIANNRMSRCIPEGSNKCRNFNAWNNNLDELSTNGILIWLDDNDEEGGTVNLSGGTNAPPTGAGLVAKNSLIAKGWTVITN